MKLGASNRMYQMELVTTRKLKTTF